MYKWQIKKLQDYGSHKDDKRNRAGMKNVIITDTTTSNKFPTKILPKIVQPFFKAKVQTEAENEAR